MPRPNVPKRSGKYFMVGKSYLENLSGLGEVVDSYREFFSKHVNCCPQAEKIVMVKLSDAAIERHWDKIRICSYRWENDKDWDGKPRDWNATNQLVIPKNYGWFIDYCIENELIGWMDFAANVVVGVPTEETMNYMGLLYCQCRTLPQFFVDPSKMPEAMSRAWVFQETAFPRLCHIAFSRFLNEFATNSKRGNMTLQIATKSGNKEQIRQFIKTAECTHQLLHRRGNGDRIDTKIADTTGYHPSSGFEEARKALEFCLASMKKLDGGDGSALVKVCLEEAASMPVTYAAQVFCTMAGMAYNILPNNQWMPLGRLIMDSLYNSHMMSVLGDFQMEIGRYARYFLNAYMNCGVGKASDRDAAVFDIFLRKTYANQVEREGQAELLTAKNDAPRILRVCWAEAIFRCNSENQGGTSCLAFPEFRSSDLEPGRRFAGLGILNGYRLADCAAGKALTPGASSLAEWTKAMTRFVIDTLDETDVAAKRSPWADELYKGVCQVMKREKRAEVYFCAPDLRVTKGFVGWTGKRQDEASGSLYVVLATPEQAKAGTATGLFVLYCHTMTKQPNGKFEKGYPLELLASGLKPKKPPCAFG